MDWQNRYQWSDQEGPHQSHGHNLPANQPSTDMQTVLRNINNAKELIGTVMEELRKEHETKK